MKKSGSAGEPRPLSLEEIAKTKGSTESETWELRLYVAGQTPRSVTAFANLKKICDQILAIPTLVRKLPQPLRKIVGDLRDTERALVGLQLRPTGTEVRE